MAGSAASLTVKILADISDFEKNMSKADRSFLKSVDKIADAGKKLTLAVTLPLAAMGVAFAKAAADNEASVKKLSRTFQNSTNDMESWIQGIKKVVPATDNELRTLTITTDTLLRSMGMAPQRAVAMTKAVTQLAADLAAYNHVELSVAQDALGKALMGKTRGLVEFGIAVSAADIKQRAYAEGVAKVGSELTSAQTAQSAWELILERSKLQQGESARTIGDNENALKRLHQSLDEVADTFGAIVLPAVASVVNKFNDLLKVLVELPAATKGTIVGIGAIAAGLPVVLMLVASLIRNVNTLRLALISLNGTSAMGGLLTVLGRIGVAAALIGVPIAAVTYAFSKQGEAARTATSNLDAYKQAVTNLTAAQAKMQLVALQTAAQGLEARRVALSGQLSALPKAGTAGYDVNATPQAAQAIASQLNAVVAQANALAPMLGAVAAQMSALNAPMAGGTTDKDGGLLDWLKRAKNASEDTERHLISLKEAAAAIAGYAPFSVLVGRPGSRSFETPISPMEMFLRRSNPSTGNTLIGNVTGTVSQAEAHQAIVNLPKTTESAIQAGFSQAGQAVVQTLTTGLQAILLGGGGRGSQFGGAVGGAFGAGIGTSIGAGIGGFLGSALPGVGTILGTMAGSFLGGLFDSHKDAVNQDTTAIRAMATQVQKVNAQLFNMVEGYKGLEAARFRATGVYSSVGTTSPYQTPDGLPSSFGGRGGQSGKPQNPSANVVNFNFYGVQNVSDFHSALDRTFNRGGAGALPFAYSVG